MKSLFAFSSVFLAAPILFFCGCNGCGSPNIKGPIPTQFEQSLSNKDTVAVESLIHEFFSDLQSKRYYDAAAMVYTRADTANPLVPLSNEEMEHFVKLYKDIPCVGYNINYMKFLSSKKNEVGCNMILAKGHDGKPDAITKLFFITAFSNGRWCLVLTDKDHFEDTFTTFEQQDSLSSIYTNYKKSHK